MHNLCDPFLCLGGGGHETGPDIFLVYAWHRGGSLESSDANLCSGLSLPRPYPTHWRWFRDVGIISTMMVRSELPLCSQPVTFLFSSWIWMAPTEMWVSASFLHEVSLLICFFFPFLFLKQFKKKKLYCVQCVPPIWCWDFGTWVLCKN